MTASALDRAIELRTVIRAVPAPVRMRCSWSVFVEVHDLLEAALIELDTLQLTAASTISWTDGGKPLSLQAHQDVEDGVIIVDTESGATVSIAWPIAPKLDVYQAEGLPTVRVNPQALATQVAQGDMEYLRFMVNQAEADEAEDYDPDRTILYDDEE